MPEYVLINRRSGLFTSEAKIASRATVGTALGLMSSAQIVADHSPEDPTARHVVLFNADSGQVAAMRATLPADAILEPVVRRALHRRIPIELQPAMPHVMGTTAAAAAATSYKVTITAGGAPLAKIDVMLYMRDPGGGIQNTTVKTDASGKVNFPVPPGFTMAFVEPIPYAKFWIMLAEAPPSGSTIDCLPIPKPPTAGGGAWWHAAMGVDVSQADRGAGIKVGVIDTGCGPHNNLKHVTLVGAFVDGKTLPGSQAKDVAEHGTHTTGIIGARPTKATDFAGMATGCDLFHARVFKGEGPQDGPTQADIINAIDSLSRDHQCDLINMSLGGGPKSEAEEDAIRDAAERGTLCICSAGNEAGPIDFPGAYKECAAVSAIGKVGWAPPGTFSANNRPHEAAKMGHDNFFLAAFSCFGPTLACAAPGVGIVSTVPDRTGFSGAYMEMDGTSMASPAACGAMAVILSQDATYKSLPRDGSRSRRAALVLSQHCKAFGLPVKFEGRGLPVV
ncbi:MAG TPA: S8 family serine peptidase [Candidatus Angelobacter sp.]|nr:S8 family serine peptidase [Candidatus Angelobacter sp.]